MSAIAGLITLDGKEMDAAVIDKMLANMRRYGPDAQRQLRSGNAVFLQALLATTPESLNELQPWTDPKTGCVVVTDSRLDNREALSASLGISGRAIDAIGDAELVLAAYQNWGAACPEKLLGDFTFAIWNPQTEILFCARDPLGVRPFYFHFIQDGIFAFASSTEALRPLLGQTPTLDEGRLADAMTDQLEGHDRCSTFFRDIKRLPPAHILQLEKSSLSAAHCFWQPLQNPPSPFPVDEKQWLEQLAAIFTEAVHCRLRSNQPINAMLSGGLDSSSVVAIASKKLKNDQQAILSTYSAISSEPNCAETRAIRLMQAGFELQSTEIDPATSSTLLQGIAAEWPRLEEPFEALNTLVHAQYLAAAQSNARIMLDGIDADALLTEADYLHQLARSGQWRKVWRESRALVNFWGREAGLAYFLRPLISEFLIPKPVRRFVRYLRGKFRASGNCEQNLINPEFAKQIDLEARYRELASNSAGMTAYDADGHQGHSVMAGSYTANGVERYHRLASFHGIEARHPFLDRRLVEFCAWLPLELRLRDGYPKWALRQAMASELPTEIAWRRGKDHLGWLFSLALWQKCGGTLTQEPLQPWLQKAVLPNLKSFYEKGLTLGEGENNADEQIEPVLKLAAINQWLIRLKAGGTFLETPK